jgi:hypothetical protein
MRWIAREKVAVISVAAGVALAATLLSACNSSALSPTSVSPTIPSAALHLYHKRRRDTPHAAVTVAVDPSQVGAAMSVNDLGSGLAVWYNLSLPGIARTFQSANLAMTRYPDGASADIFHWQTDTDGPAGTPCAGHALAGSGYDAFMTNVAIPAHLNVALEVNYGSNPTCTAGADPNNTAGWLTYARSKGYNVLSATVGNEQYVPGAIDCRQAGCTSSRDPVQYSNNEPAFYDALKAADPNVNICVDANMQPTKLAAKWNNTVFAGGKYDCAEIHYYPQRHYQPTSDSLLLTTAIPQLTTDINAVKAELATAGHPNTKLFLGEIASGLGPYGTQAQSIVTALYAGMAIGEAEQDGIWELTWHIGHGSCNTPSVGGDWTSSYGWQKKWSGAMMFSDKSNSNCPTGVPSNTLLATANAFLTGSYFVHAGEKMLGTSVAGSTDVRAYGGTYQGGYAVMLFNLNETTAQDVAVTIAGKSSGSGGTIVTYDKAIYDQSAQNVWAPPGVKSLGSWSNSINLTLPPWSMVVVQTH